MPATDDAAVATGLARELARFIDASPSPFHAVDQAARELEDAGFRRLAETDSWKEHASGRFYLVRGGSLVAWAMGEGAPAQAGFRVLGAHTDSPNLRVKPRPDRERAGCLQLAVEVYGGALWSSWLDRDLGLSGRAWVRGERGLEPRLFRIDGPLLRIPQLAIHLNREVNQEGLKLNAETHLVPLHALSQEDQLRPAAGGFRALLAEALSVERDALLSWDAMLHDVQPSTLLGSREELLSAPRLDDLCACFSALRALLAFLERMESPERVPVLCLFDHEEVGSGSSRGALSPLLRDVLERTVLARGGGREDVHRAVADSFCASIDMAHAAHPNWLERHESGHHLRMNGGPVVKVNASQRYASEGETEAHFQEACERADVPFQKFVNRADLACGSTIGPITAANLGMRTVDVGAAQLAMHSARELCGARDPELLVRALASFLER